MTRSEFQEGPATDHYHDTLGVDQATGALQTVRLLGPFAITFATPSIFSQYVALGAIPAGSRTIKTWVENVTEWTGLTDPFVRLAIGPSTSNKWSLTGSQLTAGWEDGFAGVEATPLDETAVQQVGRAITDGVSLRAKVSGTGSASAGSADVFVLIAEPS